MIVAFALGDTIHEEYREDSRKDDGADLPNMGIIINKDLKRQDNNDCFEPAMLEEAIQELYKRSWTTDHNHIIDELVHSLRNEQQFCRQVFYYFALRPLA